MIECELARLAVPLKRFPFLERFSYRRVPARPWSEPFSGTVLDPLFPLHRKPMVVDPIPDDRFVDVALRAIAPDDEFVCKTLLYAIPSAYGKETQDKLIFSMFARVNFPESFENDYIHLANIIVELFVHEYEARRDTSRPDRLEST